MFNVLLMFPLMFPTEALHEFPFQVKLKLLTQFIQHNHIVDIIYSQIAKNI